MVIKIGPPPSVIRSRIGGDLPMIYTLSFEEEAAAVLAE